MKKTEPKVKLATKNLKLANEWNYDRNGSLTPNDVTIGSNKKVWWKCHKGHEWQASVYTRNKGIGCPYCSNKKACKDNCLATTHPEIAKQWHKTKNGKLTPNDVLAGSAKKIWWQCEKKHNYIATLLARKQGYGCPYCSHQKACKDNCLATTHPEIAKQWHKTKNGKLTPNDVLAGSETKVWWKCNKGHEYQATIYSRQKGNCPICNKGNQTSFPEQTIFYYLNKHINNVYSRFKIDKKYEVDIYLKDLNIAIEYDGIFYHGRKNKKDYDIKKEKYIEEKNIKFLKIEEIEQNELICYLNGNRIFCNSEPKDEQINKIISLCFEFIFIKCKIKIENIDINVKRDRHKIYQLYISKEINNSFGKKFPKIAKEWNYKKNENLTPFMFKSGSDKIVWWKCKKGHEWEVSIGKRSSGSNCPYCSHQKLSNENSLKKINPKLAKEWNYEKNGSLKPDQVFASTPKKVWWKCNKGHEWQATINSRNFQKTNCPYCAGKKACKSNCLKTLNPELAREWNYDKNKNLIPDNITIGSNKKVWWKCNKGHEWQASVYTRNKGTGCPYCSGHLANDENNLLIKNPILAQDWNYEKNGSLTPKDICVKTSKKVWWKCNKGHEWQAKVINRNRKNTYRCPFCAGKKVCKENCLTTTHSEIAKQWHKTKNGKLTPDNTTFGSEKKVWWKCNKGHEWQARICDRTKTQKGLCPYCSGMKKI